jgi:acylphosphatase
MKLKIEITGSRVHDVDYRPWLFDMAVNASLLGIFISNRTKDKIQTVIVLAEGNEDDIRYFERTVKSEKPPRAEVDLIKSEDFAGEVMSIDKYAALNTSSQMNKAIPLLLSMNDKLDSMNDKMGSMNEKMDSMNDKLGSMNDKMGGMLQKQDRTISEIRELRGDLIKRSDDRLARIEEDIRVIKTKIGIQ